MRSMAKGSAGEIKVAKGREIVAVLRRDGWMAFLSGYYGQRWNDLGWDDEAILWAIAHMGGQWPQEKPGEFYSLTCVNALHICHVGELLAA